MRKARKPAKKPSPADAALLVKARRLAVRASAVKKGDRAQLLALIDDITTVRRRLVAECARLDEDMKRASVRTTAHRAYAQGAMAIRQRRH